MTDRRRALAGLGVVAYVVIFAVAMARSDFNVWGALLVAPALVLVSLPLLRRALRREPDDFVRAAIGAAFALKLAMALVNHAVAFGLYGGVADARGYHGAGVHYAADFWSGTFELAQQGELGRRFINTVTGVVYMVTGPTKLGGYLVYSWLAFWGLYLLYRAFVIAVPEGDRRRYAVLALLLPSTLFWTSAIGKEAWMTLAIGVTSLGAAKLLTHQRDGLALVAVGLVGASACRPHVAILLFLALLVSFLFRRAVGPPRPLGPLAGLGLLVVLLVMGSLVAGRFVHHFDLESFSPTAVGSTIERTEKQTEGGGSAFTTEGLPWPLAAGGVLFRPLPFEATNPASFLASAEGLVVLGLMVAGRRRLGTAVRGMARRPYLVYCAVYTVLFLVAFSSFRNFGTLARERVQVVPVLVALMALPPTVRDRWPVRLGSAYGRRPPAALAGSSYRTERRARAAM